MSHCYNKVSNNYHGKAKHIVVWENGDFYGDGHPISINPNYFRTWNGILSFITNTLRPSFGAVRNLIHLESQEMVNSFGLLESHAKYVALGSERLKMVPNSYKTLVEKQNLHSPRRAAEPTVLHQPSTSGIPYRGRKTILFVMTNGKSQEMPCKVVLTEADIGSWVTILEYIARSLDIPEGLKYLYTVFGEPMVNPRDIQNGCIYVAVPQNERFINMNYIRIFRSLLPMREIDLKRVETPSANPPPIIHPMIPIYDPGIEVAKSKSEGLTSIRSCTKSMDRSRQHVVERNVQQRNGPRRPKLFCYDRKIIRENGSNRNNTILSIVRSLLHEILDQVFRTEAVQEIAPKIQEYVNIHNNSVDSESVYISPQPKEDKRTPNKKKPNPDLAEPLADIIEEIPSIDTGICDLEVNGPNEKDDEPIMLNENARSISQLHLAIDNDQDGPGKQQKKVSKDKNRERSEVPPCSTSSNVLKSRVMPETAVVIQCPFKNESNNNCMENCTSSGQISKQEAISQSSPMCTPCCSETTSKNEILQSLPPMISPSNDQETSIEVKEIPCLVRNVNLKQKNILEKVKTTSCGSKNKSMTRKQSFNGNGKKLIVGDPAPAANLSKSRGISEEIKGISCSSKNKISNSKETVISKEQKTGCRPTVKSTNRQSSESCNKNKMLKSPSPTLIECTSPNLSMTGRQNLKNKCKIEQDQPKCSIVSYGSIPESSPSPTLIECTSPNLSMTGRQNLKNKCKIEQDQPKCSIVSYGSIPESLMPGSTTTDVCSNNGSSNLRTASDEILQCYQDIKNIKQEDHYCYPSMCGFKKNNYGTDRPRILQTPKEFIDDIIRSCIIIMEKGNLIPPQGFNLEINSQSDQEYAVAKDQTENVSREPFGCCKEKLSTVNEEDVFIELRRQNLADDQEWKNPDVEPTSKSNESHNSTFSDHLGQYDIAKSSGENNTSSDNDEHDQSQISQGRSESKITKVPSKTTDNSQEILSQEESLQDKNINSKSSSQRRSLLNQLSAIQPCIPTSTEESSMLSSIPQKKSSTVTSEVYFQNLRANPELASKSKSKSNSITPIVSYKFNITPSSSNRSNTRTSKIPLASGNLAAPQRLSSKGGSTHKQSSITQPRTEPSLTEKRRASPLLSATLQGRSLIKQPSIPCPMIKPIRTSSKEGGSIMSDKSSGIPQCCHKLMERLGGNLAPFGMDKISTEIMNQSLSQNTSRSDTRERSKEGAELKELGTLLYNKKSNISPQSSNLVSVDKVAEQGKGASIVIKCPSIHKSNSCVVQVQGSQSPLNVSGTLPEARSPSIMVTKETILGSSNCCKLTSASSNPKRVPSYQSHSQLNTKCQTSDSEIKQNLPEGYNLNDDGFNPYCKLCCNEHTNQIEAKGGIKKKGSRIFDIPQVREFDPEEAYEVWDSNPEVYVNNTDAPQHREVPIDQSIITMQNVRRSNQQDEVLERCPTPSILVLIEDESDDEYGNLTCRCRLLQCQCPFSCAMKLKSEATQSKITHAGSRENLNMNYSEWETCQVPPDPILSSLVDHGSSENVKSSTAIVPELPLQLSLPSLSTQTSLEGMIVGDSN